jgi:hypothetical protein
MRNQVESKAEKWYTELKKSTYKFVAIYKERIDSLFSYQKKLHEIISTTKKLEVQLRAISELHSIEMSIFSLWKQLPELDIVDSPQKQESVKYFQSQFVAAKVHSNIIHVTNVYRPFVVLRLRMIKTVLDVHVVKPSFMGILNGIN